LSDIVGEDPHRPLRILMTLHFGLDPDTGAAGVTLRLAEHLRRLGHEVEVRGTELLPGSPGRRLSHASFPLFATTRALLACVTGPRPVDVVDASTGDLGVMPAAVARRLPAALVTRSHGLEPLEAVAARRAAAAQEIPGIPPWSLYYGQPRAALVRRSLRTADAAFLLNETERDYAVDRLGVAPSRALVVRNGVNDAVLETPAPERPSGRRIAVMGPLMWRKGGAQAAAVLERVLASDPDMTAVWLGAPAGEVRAAICSERITTVERYRQEDVAALLEGCSVLLFMSRFEGLPGSVIEAMGCGLAVVAADSPGAADIVRGSGGGVLVPLDGVDEATDALLRLFDGTDLLLQMRREAWKGARRYRWDDIAADTVATYGRLIRQKRQ
jgi:glycosyltransferase involved in cell wall biosynthesis